ncbi:MAG: hypothetical protein M0031_10280 [Thermaerobacter sp.]|nr:hypothetical protein [Thermaerobacter sp.]
MSSGTALRSEGATVLVPPWAGQGTVATGADEGWAAYADASFRGGEGVWAAMLADPGGGVERIKFSGGRCAGSHEAETLAVLLAADLLRSRGVRGTVFSDAMGVVQRAGTLLSGREEVLAVLWVPREHNQMAHLLAEHGAAGWNAVKSAGRRMVIPASAMVPQPGGVPGTAFSAGGSATGLNFAVAPAKLSTAISAILRSAGMPVDMDEIRRKAVAAWPALAAKKEIDFMNALASRLGDGALLMLRDGRIAVQADGLPVIDRQEALLHINLRIAETARPGTAKKKKRADDLTLGGRSALAQMIRQEMAKCGGILPLGPLLERMTTDSPSAAIFFEKPRNIHAALGGMGELAASGSFLAVAGGKSVALLLGGVTAGPKEVAAFCGSARLEVGRLPKRPVRPVAWVSRNFRRADHLTSGGLEGSVLLLPVGGHAGARQRVLVPKDAFDGFVARHGLDEVLRARQAEAQAEALRRMEEKAAEARRLADVLSDAGADRASLGLRSPVGGPGLPGDAAMRLLSLAEAWSLLGLDPADGRRAAELGLVDLVRLGGREYVGTAKAGRVLEDRETALAPVLDGMQVAPWEAAAILGVARSVIHRLQERGRLKVVGYGSSRRAQWPLFRRGDVAALRNRLPALLRDLAAAAGR